MYYTTTPLPKTYRSINLSAAKVPIDNLNTFQALLTLYMSLWLTRLAHVCLNISVLNLFLPGLSNTERYIFYLPPALLAGFAPASLSSQYRSRASSCSMVPKTVRLLAFSIVVSGFGLGTKAPSLFLNASIFIPGNSSSACFIVEPTDGKSSPASIFLY